MYLGARSVDKNKNDFERQSDFEKSKNAQNLPYVPLAGVDNKRKNTIMNQTVVPILQFGWLPLAPPGRQTLVGVTVS